MTNLILGTQQGGILFPFAWILGKIIEVIYKGFSALGIYNIGLCIIGLVIVVRLLMIPLSIKQQKFTKINSIMTPEIQAVQKKYQGKKDQASQLAQQEEIKAIYDKYGTSPTGSCLPLLIQLPILFALYRVIMNVPAYVGPVKDLYLKVLNGLNVSQMKQFFGINDLAKNLPADKLNGCIDAMYGYTGGKSGVKLAEGVDIQNILDVADKSVASKISSLNNFFGLNLSMSPKSMFDAGMITIVVALIIPVLAGLFQFLSTFAMNKMNGSAMNQSPMGGSMKMMTYLMPLMSVYMCYIFSAGLGLYWVVSSLIQLIQQVILNIRFKNIDADKIIEANKEKAAAKAEKRKQKQGIYREKVLSASKINTKGISDIANAGNSNNEVQSTATNTSTAPKGSIASRANAVNDLNNNKR